MLLLLLLLLCCFALFFVFVLRKKNVKLGRAKYIHRREALQTTTSTKALWQGFAWSVWLEV